MRSLGICLGLMFLSGCEKGASAEVTGTAGGVTFGETKYVYFGGPFFVISATDVECVDLSWVRPAYQEGSSPTDQDIKLLQFAYASGAVSTGEKSVGPGASVTAKVVTVAGGALSQSSASSGSISVSEVVDEETATGEFSGIAFDDGTLDGSFEAEWCITLKDR